MSFNVDFFRISKKKNSTYIPPGTTIVKRESCTVKEGTGVLNPVITIADSSASFNPSLWNYCHISSFSRYYWVSDWKNEDNLWTAQLSVDVLATYKSDIESKNFYILRASTAFNTNVVDTLYPCQANHNLKIKSATLWEDVGFNNGSIVSAIMGSDGLIFYYVFTPALFRTLITKMFSGIDWMNISTSDIPDSVQKAVTNPAQYILSAKWFPFDCSTDVIQTSVNVGWWNLPLNGNISIFTAGARPKTFHTTITRDAHPQASRGDWLNHEPYTKLDLFVRPFGMFHLDSNLLSVTAEIDVYCNVDLVTGDADLIIRTDSQILATTRSNIACPIQVGDIQQSASRETVTRAAATKGLVSIFSNIFKGAGNSTENTDSYIFNAVNAASSKVDVRYGAGSMLSTYGNVLLNEDCIIVTDDDNADNGRPYCKNGTLKDMGVGYYQVENGHTSLLGAYESEIDMVKSFLEKGVYYA